MKKWEVILDNGYRSILETEDKDEPSIKYDKEARKAFLQFGYDGKFGMIDASRLVVCRPLLDDLSEKVMDALKKKENPKDDIPF